MKRSLSSFQANVNHAPRFQQLAKNKTVMVEHRGDTLDYLFAFQQGKPELHHHCEAMTHKSLFVLKPDHEALRAFTAGGNYIIQLSKSWI